MNAGETAARYRRFAQFEARGSSDAYERLALAVASDGATLAFLGRLDPRQQQPNLLFGALRWHDVDVADPVTALSWLNANADAVLEVMRTRRTQTNEVARCATLLPALAQLREPLALIEVGASAGLCLLYDAWRYRYVGLGVDHQVGSASSPVLLSCSVTGDVPLPEKVPTIMWRAGLDVSPIDARIQDERRWLECLVWPEHQDRTERLRAALDVAAGAALRIDAGDLLEDLPALLEEAPTDATVVVLHSATLAYVDPPTRLAFLAMMARQRVHRLGAEALGVLPHRPPTKARIDGHFVVSLDQHAVALAHPHGRSLAWF